MTKLHEILAVEGSLEKTARHLTDGAITTFGKENLFTGRVRELTMFDEAQAHLNTREEQKLETTVDEIVDYAANGVADYYDVVYQKELANQKAIADLEVDGTVIAKDVPAVFLLGLETKLGRLRDMYQAVPTLQPGTKWIIDPTERSGVFVTANDSTAFKTEKTVDFVVAYEATDHHPAQIKEVSKTENVGKITTTTWSGMLTPVEKAARIARIDNLLKAAKAARMRANNVDVDKDRKIGNSILNYIKFG